MPSKENSGALFKNNKEGGNPNWPDYKGSINVDGTEYWLSAWIKKSEKGTSYMSLSVKRKEALANQPQTRQQAMKAVTDLEDEIPF